MFINLSPRRALTTFGCVTVTPEENVRLLVKRVVVIVGYEPYSIVESVCRRLSLVHVLTLWTLVDVRRCYTLFTVRASAYVNTLLFRIEYGIPHRSSCDTRVRVDRPG